LLGLDCKCSIFDYKSADTPRLLDRWIPGDAEKRKRKRRTLALIEAIRQNQPDTLLIHTLRFDMAQLREAFDGLLVLWDLDGPAGFLESGEVPLDAGFDLVVTVSRHSFRKLEAQASVPVRYLPNGVSLSSFSPGAIDYSQRRRFQSELACLGRATARRVDYLGSLADALATAPSQPLSAGEKPNLVLWGRRWHQAEFSRQNLRNSYRESRDIEGPDAIALYRASRVMLNILREPFAEASPPTVMSLEVFHVPACGTCLLTAWVEELEDAFEPGREILCFRSRDEFLELAQRYASDSKAASEIGKAGRRRIEAEHTLQHRASDLLRFLDEIS